VDSSIAASRKLSIPEAAQYLGLSRSYLNKLRLYGRGPVYAKLGKRVLYDRNDLEAWVAAGRRNNTSQKPGQQAP
jgi:excisionase family DNA binding protein